MGVSTNIYTYYGVKIPYDHELAGAYDEHYLNPQAPDILFGEEYIVLGKRLFDSGDFRYALEDGDDWKQIDIGMLPAFEIDYRIQFAKFYPDLTHLLEKPFRLFTFTHYS